VGPEEEKCSCHGNPTCCLLALLCLKHISVEAGTWGNGMVGRSMGGRVDGWQTRCGVVDGRLSGQTRRARIATRAMPQNHPSPSTQPQQCRLSATSLARHAMPAVDISAHGENAQTRHAERRYRRLFRSLARWAPSRYNRAWGSGGRMGGHRHARRTPLSSRPRRATWRHIKPRENVLRRQHRGRASRTPSLFAACPTSVPLTTSAGRRGILCAPSTIHAWEKHRSAHPPAYHSLAGGVATEGGETGWKNMTARRGGGPPANSHTCLTILSPHEKAGICVSF